MPLPAASTDHLLLVGNRPTEPAFAAVPAVPPGADLQALVQQHQAAALLLHAPWPVLAPAVQAWSGLPPCPVVWLGPVHDIAILVRAGIGAFCSAGGDLDAALAEARARHERDAGLYARAAAVRSELDDRKWIDRAKGVLMNARAMPEDEAFRLLRSAAMHANLKLAQVSRSVVDAARWAQAVNRAGQLRMLSQRLVSLAAQRLLRVDGARARAAQAAARVRDNVAELSALALTGAPAQALAGVQQAWQTLQPLLAGRLDSARLPAIDAGAEALLAAAEALTEQLEEIGGRRALGVVNLCGRQRMRSQRVAKEALLGLLLPAAEYHRRLQPLLSEFEQVLGQIEAAPLSSPEIRAALADARADWLLLMRALRGADATALGFAADRLLEPLDRLTDCCEHSLQTLLA